MDKSLYYRARNYNGGVYYLLDNGTVEWREQGSTEWQTNNTVKMPHNEFAILNGAVGTTKNGVAIFPNEKASHIAFKDYFNAECHKELTVTDFITQYKKSQTFDNHTDASIHQFLDKLARHTGIDVNKKKANELTMNEKSNLFEFVYSQADIRKGKVYESDGIDGSKKLPAG